MAKAFFRFLRGELNGYYLNAINDTLNQSLTEVRKFLSDFYKLTFSPSSMSEDMIYGIGKFAGVFIPRLSSSEGYGSFRMSESSKLNNQEVSERGLFDKATEAFSFRFAGDESVDINEHATVDLRSSMAGTNDTVEGYISSTETDVLDDEGEVQDEAVLPTPPSGVAYSDFYGKKFLFLADPIVIKHNIDIELFYPLYKVMQYIRYNGENIASLCKLIEIICPNGMVQITEIHKHALYPCIEVKYKYTDIVMDFKTQRMATFLYVMAQKFPQVVLTEVIE